MSHFTKHTQSGYDANDEELQADLEKFLAKNPKTARKWLNRIHDGILQRMKEEGARKCGPLLDDLVKCVNDNLWQESNCLGHRNAVNACYQTVNSEENYQRLRLAFIRGDLARDYAVKTKNVIEQFNKKVPDAEWKVHWAERADRAEKWAGVQPDTSSESGSSGASQ